jgi:hypothetical protein
MPCGWGGIFWIPLPDLVETREKMVNALVTEVKEDLYRLA